MFEFEDDVATGTLKKHPMNNARDEGNARLATAPREPSFNAQPGPEQLYFGSDSGSDLSLLGLSSTHTHNQESTHRTATISGLPANMTLVTVLNKIRGGAILESELDTDPITGTNTARVVFVDEFSAQAFGENAPVHPSMFGGMNVTVDLVSTPPVEYDHGHSRCLEIRGFLVLVTAEGLLAAIGHESNHPIQMRKLDNNNIILHFSSIEKAEHAYGVLPRAYHGCQPHFIADPCSEPLEPFEALLPPRGFLPL